MKQGWEIKKLGAVCNLYQPKTISGEMLIEDGKYLVYGANGVIGRYNQYNHENSEVLLTCRGATCGTINMSAPYSWINGNAMVVQPKTDNITKQFLALYLQSVDWKNVITGAAQPQITRQSLSPLTIEVPPREEQERIVEVLDREFERIDAMKANAEQNLQHAKDLFQAALRKELQPKEGWETAPMSKIYDVRDGTHDSPRYHTTGYPLITSKNLCEDFIDMDNVKYISKEDYDKINERSNVEIGDVLFAMIGTIGNPTLVVKEPNFAIKNMALFKVPNNQSGSLLRYILSTDEVLGEMKKKAKGSNQPFVSLGYLRGFEISIPATREQQDEIVARLDILNERCKALEENYKKTIALCDDMKQALLRKAFNGEL